MKTILKGAIDWVSVKLNAVCLIGLFTGSKLIYTLTAVATATTIIYNSIRIFKELKTHKKK